VLGDFGWTGFEWSRNTSGQLSLGFGSSFNQVIDIDLSSSGHS
jgi:hypothetical protein